jgi:hypothetical protein
MELISKLISEHGSELIASLTGKGFSQEQAERFLPEAGNSVADAVSGLSGLPDADSILGKIDIGALAQKTGIDSSLVSNGLSALVPMLLSRLGGGGLGGLMGKVGKLF